MRIALVSGTEVADAQERRRMMSALQDAQQQVVEHVITGQGADLRSAVPGFAWTLRSAWSKERPDVVHAFGWAGGLAALAAARDEGLPVVTAFGSLAMTERRHGLDSPQLQPERSRLERAIGSSSCAVIAASSEEAGDLVRMGVSRRRVHVIPAGVDTSVFTQEGPVSPQARGAEKAAVKPRIATAADVDDEQAVTLARAMAAVPGAELIACPSSVSSGGELAALLRSADVFVHVPVHAPRGTACLQAMACGVPVIASAVGAHVDIMVDGTTGLLVPPGRPDLLAARIRHLLAHPILRQASGVAAADRAQSRYARDRVTAETLAVYESAAQVRQLAA
jgi:glycosyltransferase involved in cell wall biosynthesis